MLRPLLYALVPLLLDSLGVIVFAILLALHMALVPATIVGAVVGCAVVAWEALRHRRVPALQWVSLALILFSAGAVMLSGDARFVMVKPSIIYAVVGLAMLRRAGPHCRVARVHRRLPAGIETVAVRGPVPDGQRDRPCAGGTGPLVTL